MFKLLLVTMMCFRASFALAEVDYDGLMSNGQFGEARELSRKNLSQLQTSAEPDSFLSLAQYYAETFLDKDQFESARIVFDAVETAHASGYLEPSVELSYTLMYSAYAYLLTDEEHLARREIERSRKILEKNHTTNPTLAFQTSDRLFTIARQILADHELSVTLGEEALQRALASSDVSPYTLASVCNILAEEYRAWHGDYMRAEELLSQALEVIEPYFPDRESFPQIFASYSGFISDLASLYQMQGKLNQSERLYLQALKIVDENPDITLSRRIIAKLNLGVVYLDQMRLNEAEPLLTEALTLAHPGFSKSTRLIYCLTEMARLQRKQGRFDQAKIKYSEALALLGADKNADPFYLSQVYYDLGNLYLTSGETSLARSQFVRAVTLRRDVLGQDNPATAVASVAWLSTDPSNLTLSAKIDQLSAAVEILSRDVSRESVRIEALGLRGRAYRAIADDEKAQQDLALALRLAESVRGRRGGNDESRARYLASIRTIYEDLIDLHIAAGRNFAALSVAESARARSLADRLGNWANQGEVQTVEFRNLKRRQSELLGQVASLQRAKNSAMIAANSEQVQRFAAEIRLVFTNLNLVSDELDLHNDSWQRHLERGTEVPFMRSELSAVIAENEAALLYFLGDLRSYAFLVPPEGEIRSYVIGSALLSGKKSHQNSLGVNSQFEDQARTSALRSVGGVAYLDEQITDESKAWSSRASELHALFIGFVPPALWQAVNEYESIVILPDGMLHAIPFEALVVEPARDLAATVFWLDCGPALRYAPSLTSLISITHRTPLHREKFTLLSVVNPSYGDGGPWAPLPGTQAEGALVQAAFAGADQVALEGTEATEENLKKYAGQARYLHIATHGVIRNDSTGLMAALVLTPETTSVSQEEDGYFHLYEIRQTPMVAQLAVLSACETNWGKSIPSEGVLTLSRAFLEAGAQRTVASLWPVSDASTAKLIGDFFSAIATSESSGMVPHYSFLLRDAKRKIRNSADFSDPHHWAPFVLSGIK